MSNDIVERLREGVYRYNHETRSTERHITKNERLAADEIERLRAELAATRAALQYARNLIGPDEIIDAALKGDGDE